MIATLWDEFLALEWDPQETEVIGGPYGDCLVAAPNHCGITPSVHPAQKFLALSVYSQRPPEEWAARLGHGAIVWRTTDRGGDTFILVPQEESLRP